MQTCVARDVPFYRADGRVFADGDRDGDGVCAGAEVNAQVVAVLGLLGGFLTPILLPARTDNALGLFGYLALLDLGCSRLRCASVGIISRCWRRSRRWACSTVGATVLHSDEAGIANTIFLGFAALFVAAFGMRTISNALSSFFRGGVRGAGRRADFPAVYSLAPVARAGAERHPVVHICLSHRRGLSLRSRGGGMICGWRHWPAAERCSCYCRVGPRNI